MERIFRNLRTFFLALILALAVWVSAVTSADPDEVHEYPRPVLVQIVGQDPSLVIVGNVPTSVTITLRAPHSVWNQLNTGDNQVRAIMDLSGLEAGEHEVKIQPQVTASPVKVISVSLQSVQVNLEPLATVSLPIKLSLLGEPAIGFQAGNPVIDPPEAVISGPQSQVNQASSLQVVLSMAGLRQDVQSSLPIKVLDSTGKIISGLTLSPENVQVSLPVTQQGGYRDIAVKVSVRGQQAGGYRVTNVSVFPPVITVYSQNPALVNDLPGYVETEPLNLNGESENVDTHLKLNLPDGITVVGNQTVQVQVGISPIEGSLSLTGIPVELTGLAPGLIAHISPNQLDVILTGPLPLLDKLTPGDIKFVVDLTGLDKGTHQATPQAVILITNIHVQSLNPGTVEVIITQGELQTPIFSPTPGGPLTATPTPTWTPVP